MLPVDPPRLGSTLESALNLGDNCEGASLIGDEREVNSLIEGNLIDVGVVDDII